MRDPHPALAGVRQAQQDTGGGRQRHLPQPLLQRDAHLLRRRGTGEAAGRFHDVSRPPQNGEAETYTDRQIHTHTHLSSLPLEHGAKWKLGRRMWKKKKRPLSPSPLTHPFSRSLRRGNMSAARVWLPQRGHLYIRFYLFFLVVISCLVLTCWSPRYPPRDVPNNLPQLWDRMCTAFCAYIREWGWWGRRGGDWGGAPEPSRSTDFVVLCTSVANVVFHNKTWTLWWQRSGRQT